MTIVEICEDARRQVEFSNKHERWAMESVMGDIDFFGHVTEHSKQSLLFAREMDAERCATYARMRKATTYEELADAYCGR